MSTKSAETTSTGTLVATGARVMGVYLVPAASGGSAVFKSGGAGGTTVLTLDTPAQAGEVYIDVPGAGLDFGTDCHVTLTNVTACTIFYEDL